ncbi:MAG: putative lipid II flippase FtsW [Oligoflexales bacterium]|nr:putative lipid II flippase FtsW [Oligoflexales bacterium]
MTVQNRKTLFFYLLTTTTLLSSFGLLYVYAASGMKGVELYQNSYYFFFKQAITISLGFFLIFVLRRVPLSWLKNVPAPFLLLTLSLLALVFIPGAYSKVGGASRWLNLSLGGFRFQPSEAAKLALIFFLAKNLSRKSANINRFWSGVFPNLLVCAVISALLLLQPDFGTAVLLSLLTFLMLFVAGASRRFTIASCVLGVLGLATALIAAPYRLRRLLSFLDPWGNIHAGGFQIIQSFLAFQNGQLFGVGFGESKQKLFFLPEAHTDFIFSVLAEETGAFGVLLTSGLFFFLICICFKISLLQQNLYHKFLGFGMSSLLAIQSLFNMGVVTGLLPTKGIPLPFMSSGSSSLITSFFIIGILGRLASSTETI